MASSPSSVPAPREPPAHPARTPAEDVILPHARTEDGAGLHVLRKRGEVIEAGVVRAMREGQPIHGELVKLAQREGTPLFDVEVLHDARRDASATGLGRPARVSNARFREGWDRIFGGSSEEPS